MCYRKSAGQRISVCVRKRPLTRAECRRGEADVVTTLSGECVIVHESKEAVDLAQYILQVAINSREETGTNQCFVMSCTHSDRNCCVFINFSLFVSSAQVLL